MSLNTLPKISIVTPSYNQACFLEDTMRSVLEQRYPNLEYVVIDGGSTDNSREIIQKYASRLHYWTSERDKGHGDALNKGFAKTSGEIMAWINSDDKYLPWTFRVVAEIFSSFPHVKWIVGYNAFWNEQGEMTTVRRGPRNIYDFINGDYFWIQQESVFWRRELWDASGGKINSDFKFMVDGELWCRFFLNADLYTVDSVLGGYRMHSTNRALLNDKQCREEMDNAIREMKKHLPLHLRKNLLLKSVFQRVQNSLQGTQLSLGHFIKAWNILFPKSYQIPLTFFPFIRTIGYKNIYYDNNRWIERYL